MENKKQIVRELNAEGAALISKIEKLTIFLKNKQASVSDEQKYWMNVQLHSMKNYLRCIRKRIKDLEA